MQRTRHFLCLLPLLAACPGGPVSPPTSTEARLNTLGLRLVELPASTPLWLAATETTQSAFATFVSATGHVTTAEQLGGAKVWSGDTWILDPTATWHTVFPGSSRPVVAVSWHDATAFCEWLTAHERELGELPEDFVYRLPTDAEWELAARAGTHRVYAGTDEPAQLCRYANVPDKSAAAASLGREVVPCDDGLGIGTAEVGSYEPNAWGLHDMTGNVWEWTSSPAPDDPSLRSMRGGSWSGKLEGLRVDYRDVYPPELRGGAIGFRVVLAAP
jgi:sulfatase modifying factor 1